MTYSRVLCSAALSLLVGCGQKPAPAEDPTSRMDSAAGTFEMHHDTTARTDSATAGMAHGAMPDMPPATRGAPAEMMDHTRMPGMAAPAGSRRDAMDHGQLPGMPAPAMRDMRGAQMQPAAGGHMPTDHAMMPRTPAATGISAARMAAEVKLDAFLDALLRDSVVRQRIRSDGTLRRQWDSAAARGILLARPN